jgi:hypothetical protein
VAESVRIDGTPAEDPRVLDRAHARERVLQRFLGVPLDHDPPAGGAWGTGGLESAWSARLAGNLVRRLLPDPLLTTDAPPAVELVLNAHDGHWALHLLDHQAGDPRHLDLDGLATLRGPIKVRLDPARLPVTRARRVDGSSVPVGRSEDRIEISVDGLAVADVVVLHGEEGDRP